MFASVSICALCVPAETRTEYWMSWKCSYKPAVMCRRDTWSWICSNFWDIFPAPQTKSSFRTMATLAMCFDTTEALIKGKLSAPIMYIKNSPN